MSGDEIKQSAAAGALKTTKSTDESLGDLRQRQAYVSKILEQLFGPFGESNPKLWRRRAYLLLVGIVYEGLATGDLQVSTKELIELTKVLANTELPNRNGRVKANSKVRTKASGEGTALKEAVRELYGTSLH